jgi:uncharacterized cupin superfamily protein
MGITIIKALGELPRSALQSLGSVKEPLGTPVAQLWSTVYRQEPESGVWECSPGRWRRQVKAGEFCHFTTGYCRFEPDDGAPIEIRAGDTVYFPPNTTGVWEVFETIRKTYLMIPQVGE